MAAPSPGELYGPGLLSMPHTDQDQASAGHQSQGQPAGWVVADLLGLCQKSRYDATMLCILNYTPPSLGAWIFFNGSACPASAHAHAKTAASHDGTSHITPAGDRTTLPRDQSVQEGHTCIRASWWLPREPKSAAGGMRPAAMSSSMLRSAGSETSASRSDASARRPLSMLCCVSPFCRLAMSARSCRLPPRSCRGDSGAGSGTASRGAACVRTEGSQQWACQHFLALREVSLQHGYTAAGKLIRQGTRWSGVSGASHAFVEGRQPCVTRQCCLSGSHHHSLQQAA